MTAIIYASATISDSQVSANITIKSLGGTIVKTGVTPLTAYVANGQYYVIASYPGYETMMSYVDLRYGGTQKIGFKLFPAQPKPPIPPVSKGKLAVKTFYKGREISSRVTVFTWLNFYTPRTIELPVGTYTLRTSMYWRNKSIVVNVEKDVTKPVNFVF